MLINGIIPNINIADLTMAGDLNDEMAQQIRTLALESLLLLTHTNYELNTQRKLLIELDIGKDYAALFSMHVPFTDWLFEDDLQKQLKDIGDDNKVSARYHPAQKPPYANSGNYNSQAFKPSKNFRGQSFNKKGRRGRGAYNNRPQRQ